MSADRADTLTATPATGTGDRITHGAVHLDVTDLGRSTAFWRAVVGLTPVPHDGDGVALGAGGRAIVILHPGALRGAPRGVAGLYHLAVHVPDVGEFARAVLRLAQARVAQAPTDHIYSMATYATAPDGIGLEITVETPERFDRFEIGPRTIAMWDAQGRRREPTEALDLEPVLARRSDLPVGDPMTPGTAIGHVHLHVPDLADAVAFYRDVVGFDEHMVMPQIGMADLSAGGRFPHRLAVNTWYGPGVVQAPAGSAGMRMFELRVADGETRDSVAARAATTGPVNRDGDAVLITDPAGNRVHVTARAA